MRRMDFEKVLGDKAFNVAKDPKYNEYQRGLASAVYKIFDKKAAGIGVTTLGNKSASNNEIKQNRRFLDLATQQ